VMLSSSCEELDLKEAQRLGASAYVVKPVRFQDFVDAVKTIGRFWGLLNVLRPGGIEAVQRIEAVQHIDTVQGVAYPG
jgi:CheY-like chemotaxis protein